MLWTPDLSPAFLDQQQQKAVVNKIDWKSALKTMFVFRSSKYLNFNEKKGQLLSHNCSLFFLQKKLLVQLRHLTILWH